MTDQCAPLARRLKLASSSSRGGTLLLLVATENPRRRHLVLQLTKQKREELNLC